MIRGGEINHRMPLWGYEGSCNIEEPMDGNSCENQIVPR